ncbi:MAG TPA: DNA damage-inducible protein D [Candidatus Moranbacteria bacterium]|nr:DNA damage-inducible protein D [Candidatus Moranbacteria bacterium]HBY11490.1 DNA damage-inducible protein D [Candidatus Moranbacteria bacterium]
MNSLNKDFESIKKVNKQGIEYWEARELMPLLGYIEWRKFEGVILRAKDACETSNQKVSDHFVGAAKMVKLGSGSIRKIENYKLSRYACYLIAQNGDSRKKEIATAQTYFAVQTRKQEIFEQASEVNKRLFIRGEVKKHNKKLFDTAKQAGVSNFGKFNNFGYLGLYGLDAEQIKEKKKIGKDDILDRAGATELAANLFRITQTDEKIIKESIIGEGRANITHFHVGREVRETIKRVRGTMPENLFPETHIKELKKEKRKFLKK